MNLYDPRPWFHDKFKAHSDCTTCNGKGYYEGDTSNGYNTQIPCEDCMFRYIDDLKKTIDTMLSIPGVASCISGEINEPL